MSADYVDVHGCSGCFFPNGRTVPPIPNTSQLRRYDARGRAFAGMGANDQWPHVPIEAEGQRGKPRSLRREACLQSTRERGRRGTAVTRTAKSPDAVNHHWHRIWPTAQRGQIAKPRAIARMPPRDRPPPRCCPAVAMHFAACISAAVRLSVRRELLYAASVDGRCARVPAASIVRIVLCSPSIPYRCSVQVPAPVQLVGVRFGRP
jgi:hypothetical protein